MKMTVYKRANLCIWRVVEINGMIKCPNIRKRCWWMKYKIFLLWRNEWYRPNIPANLRPNQLSIFHICFIDYVYWCLILWSTLSLGTWKQVVFKMILCERNENCYLLILWNGSRVWRNLKSGFENINLKHKKGWVCEK